MKKLFLYLTVIVFFTACTSDTKTTENNVNDTLVTTATPSQPEELFDVPWAAILDSSSQIISMTQTEEVRAEDLNIQNVTESLNRKYPEVFISDPILRNDTVFVNIKDASYLTQGTGTMGAEIYLAESTYSYTEIPGVGFVNFKFLEGDHASPGTYVRKNFEFKK